jgi:hypothetical protein
VKRRGISRWMENRGSARRGCTDDRKMMDGI